MQIDYIECAGVRVPADWTPEQLRNALEKRQIRFTTIHEREIMGVFGDAILLKKTLEESIDKLTEVRDKIQGEVNKIQGEVNEKTKLLACPHCGLQWRGLDPARPVLAQPEVVKKSKKVERAKAAEKSK